MEDAKRQTLARIVRAGAEEMLPRQLALLEQICAIDSGTGNEAGNAAVTGLLEPVLSELGARTERVREPGLGTHLVARVRPEQPRGKVLLAAHLDTVFGPGFAEKHPFHIEGEWAHGLGAGDCKSGVLISLFGALILKKAGLLPPWELTYLFTCDEETGSRSGRKVYAREAQDAALALVFEGGRERDGRPRFVTSRRGVILGTVDVAGREAHAGKAYLEGRSAVLERYFGEENPAPCGVCDICLARKRAAKAAAREAGTAPGTALPEAAGDAPGSESALREKLLARLARSPADPHRLAAELACPPERLAEAVRELLGKGAVRTFADGRIALFSGPDGPDKAK